MFRDFSFAGAGCGLSTDVIATPSVDISPTATPAPLEISKQEDQGFIDPSIASLQQSLIRHQLDTRQYVIGHKDESEPCSPATDSSEHQQAEPSSRHLSFTPANYRYSTVRLQRQLHARLQSSPCHLDKIRALVGRMVDMETQCNISTSKSPYDTDDADSDEDSGVECETRSTRRSDSLPILKYRRSGELRRGTTCVKKSIRQRKKRDRLIRET
jgi:hypothetical protein